MNENLDILDSAKVPDNLLNHDRSLQLLERSVVLWKYLYKDDDFLKMSFE